MAQTTPGTRQGYQTQQPNPGNTDQLRQQYSSGATTATADPDDPPVFWGREPIRTSGSREPFRGPATYEGEQDRTKTLSESELDFYGLSEAELRRVQESAFQAGVYGDERDDVPWGDYDEDSFKFWRTMVGRSAAFLTRGKKVSPWDAMDSAAKAGRNRPGAKGPTKEPLVIRDLVAEEDIDALGDRIAEEEIGMGISDAEVRNYMSAYQAMQTSAQQTAYAASGSGLPGGPGGTVPALPELSSWLLKRIKEDHPEEYSKTQYRNAVHTVLSLIEAGGLGI